MPLSPLASQFSRTASRAAFTLVELLVSITILSLIVLVATQLVNQAGLTINRSGAKLDTDAEIRAVFNRMDTDFAAMLKRPDVDYVMKRPAPDDYLATVAFDLKAPPENDQMYFYSRARGYYPKVGSPPNVVDVEPFKRSDTTLVGYRINRFFQLERCGRSLVKDPSSSSVGAAGDPLAPMVFLPLTITTYNSGGIKFDALNKLLNDPRNTTSGQRTPKIDGTLTGDPSFEVIGEQVFRLEYSFLFKNDVLKDGRTASRTAYPLPGDVSPTSKYSFPPADPSKVPPIPSPYGGLRHVSAIVVTLATLDNRARGLAPTRDVAGKTDVPDLTRAALALLDPAELEVPGSGGAPADRRSVATQWQRILDAPNNAFRTTSGLNAAAASSVRIYERVFPLQSPD